MPDDPSLADPYSFFNPQQQPIAQGPTVAATPASTNSLADLANVIMPALAGLAGAKANKQPGLLGAIAGAGAGADAMTRERVLARQLQEQQEVMQYRKASMVHMQSEAQMLGTKAQELQSRMANSQEFRKTLSGADLALYDAEPDHKSYFKAHMHDAVIDSEKRNIVQLSNGQIKPDQLAGLGSDTIHNFSDEMNKAFAKGSQPPTFSQLEKAEHDRNIEAYQQARLGIERQKLQGSVTEGKLASMYGQYMNAREKLENDPFLEKDKLPPRLSFGEFEKQFKTDKPESSTKDESKATDVDLDFSKYKDMSAAYPVLKKAFPDKINDYNFLADYYLSHGGKAE